MYKCNDCGMYFEDPEIIVDSETGEEKVCPICGRDYLEEVNACKVCEKPTESGFDDFCPDCMDKLRLGLNEIMDEIGTDADTFGYMIVEYFNW